MLRLLRDESDYKAYADYVQTSYLKRLFAEAKIVSGKGKRDELIDYIGANEYRLLKRRTDIDFLPTNPSLYKGDTPVVLSVALKNVPALIVKVYHLHALNYCRQSKRAISLDIDLSGLVANVERRIIYKDDPFLRIERKLKFPSLNKAGTYVIELVGNGKQSRMLLTKGRLHCIEKIGSAGHQFNIYNENHGAMPNSGIILDGKEYKADKNGRVIIPFSNKSHHGRVIVFGGNLAKWQYFSHKDEVYKLDAEFFVDREQLVKGAQAMVLVRPLLSIPSVSKNFPLSLGINPPDCISSAAPRLMAMQMIT